MRKHPVRTGSLSILLLVVCVVLAVLAVLNWVTAKTGLDQATTFATASQEYYENDSAAKEWLASLDTNGANQREIYVVDGIPMAPGKVSTSNNSAQNGISESGLSQDDTADNAGTCALHVVVRKVGDTYQVRTWDQVRVYM